MVYLDADFFDLGLVVRGEGEDLLTAWIKCIVLAIQQAIEHVLILELLFKE